MTTSPSSPVRLQGVLGDELLGVYAGGSFALGAYEPGRSDIDVTAVVAGAARARDEAGDRRARSATRRCRAPPAASSSSSTRSPPRARAAAAPGFELNLNTGAAMASGSTSSPARSRASGSRSTARSCAQHGLPLTRAAGRGAVRADPARQRCSRCSPESIRWHRDSDVPLGADVVLNTCRRCASRPRGRGRPSARRARGPRTIPPCARRSRASRSTATRSPRCLRRCGSAALSASRSGHGVASGRMAKRNPASKTKSGNPAIPPALATSSPRAARRRNSTRAAATPPKGGGQTPAPDPSPAAR